MRGPDGTAQPGAALAAVMPPWGRASSMGAATPPVLPGQNRGKGPGSLVAAPGPAQLWAPQPRKDAPWPWGCLWSPPVLLGDAWVLSACQVLWFTWPHHEEGHLLPHIALRAAEPGSPRSCPPSQALTTSLQGFLHSLAYGWLRRNFRREAVGQRPSLQHHRGLQGFYDESLGAIA